MKKPPARDAAPAAEKTGPSVPEDLRAALAADPAARAKWDALTPIARRDFLSWLDAAKQAETRLRRIGKACSMLLAGKRRPCCYSIVSFSLYSALKAAPRAKAQWSGLSPDERRDFIAWMDAEKEPALHKRRIEQACAALAAGKRQP